VEAAFLHSGDDLRPDTGESLRLVDDDAATGFAHGRGDGVVVEGHDRAEIDHLDAAALRRCGLGGIQ